MDFWRHSYLNEESGSSAPVDHFRVMEPRQISKSTGGEMPLLLASLFSITLAECYQLDPRIATRSLKTL